MATVKRLTPLEQDQAAHSYLDLLKENMAPSQLPDAGRWQPLLALMKEACERANGNRAYIYESTLNSLISSKQYYGLKELVEGKPVPKPMTKEPDTAYVPELPTSAKLPEHLSRGACGWLDAYVEYSKRASPEGYEDFHEACGLWVLSTIASRRVKVPVGKQYTPLMVVLVARTSMYAKTTTANVAVDVLQAARLRWLLGNDRTTPQKLLSDMVGNIPEAYGDMDIDRQYQMEKRLAMAAQRGWRFDEFGELIKAFTKTGGVMDDLKGLLLQLDDCLDSYKYGTQKRGDECIEKPYLALLGCMTPANIRMSAKSSGEFWNDGFWARFIFVAPPPGNGIDCPFEEGEMHVPDHLSQPLRDWHERLEMPEISIEAVRDEKGKFQRWQVNRGILNEEKLQLGTGVYQAWISYRSALKKLTTDMGTEDFDGSYVRLPIKAMRVAALFASFEGSRFIELNHWAKAQEIAERWRKALHELYSQVNKAGETSTGKKLEDDILKTVKRLSEQYKAPTIRDLSRYMTKTSIGMLKMAVRDLTINKLLHEDKSGRSPRYSIHTMEDEDE